MEFRMKFHQCQKFTFVLLHKLIHAVPATFNFFAALPDLKEKWCLYSICEMHETDPIYRLILSTLREQTRMFHLHPIWRWNEEWPRSSWTVLMLNCSPARDVNRLPNQSQRCSTYRSPNVHFISIALQIRLIIHIFRPVFVFVLPECS